MFAWDVAAGIAGRVREMSEKDEYMKTELEQAKDLLLKLRARRR